MVVVNKILNILIFILAVAACYVSVNLNSRRAQLKDRADSIQKAFIATAATVKGDAEKDTATNVIVSSITDEKLSWKGYLAAGSEEAYSSALDELAKATAQVVLQKENMAAGYNVIAEALKLERNSDLQNLNDVDTYSDNVTAITSKVGGISSRANLIAEKLETISKTLGTKQPARNLNALNDVDEELKGNLSAINTAAGKLLDKNNELSKGYNKIAAALEGIENERLQEMFKFTFNAEDFGGDRSDIKRAVTAFASDLKNTKNSLEEYLATLQSVQSSSDRLARLKETVGELEKENADLKLAHGKAENRVEILNTKIEVLTEEIAKTGKALLPKDLVAIVSQVNDKFDFVVLNKGSEDKVIVGGVLLIHDGSNFVCKVVVTKVHKNSSVCDILPVTRPKNAQGQYIMPIIGNEAVVPTI
ncbi:MAG: hypothetical protein HRT88_06495 [Lentisphaeraceae bacterium]|nr:hypothetical protein [Lentisphaeraceae bacterium]